MKIRDSLEWKYFRKRMLNRANNSCQLCGTRYVGKRNKVLHIHHMDETQYTNYDPHKFVVCCEACHELLEKMQYRLKYKPELLSDEMREKWLHLLDKFIILNKGDENGHE